MATVKLSIIRSRVATAVEAIVGAGLKQSPLPYGAFGRTPNSIAHKAFSIGMGGSNAQDDRQRPTEGAMLQTDMDIKVSFRIRPLAQLVDVDASLDLENTIIANVLDRTNTTLYQNLHIKLLSTNRQLTDSGEYMISTLSFELLHFIPLTT
jgi:hypothetical protein|tara:strand:+ start:10305 stop:10757 length:453 start_codon:yes stop_codon:yes gene_type:complete